jgi:hypothetical protein
VYSQEEGNGKTLACITWLAAEGHSMDYREEAGITGGVYTSTQGQEREREEEHVCEWLNSPILTTS